MKKTSMPYEYKGRVDFVRLKKDDEPGNSKWIRESFEWHSVTNGVSLAQATNNFKNQLVKKYHAAYKSIVLSAEAHPLELAP